METFLIIVYFIVWMLISLGVAILFDPFSYWTHRKGYPNPGWKFLVTFPLFLGIIGTIVVGINSLATTVNEGYYLSAASLLGLFLLMFIPGPLGLGGSFLVLGLLPQRQMRMAGSHRSGIPYAALGYAAILFAGMVVILSIMAQDYYSYAVRCAAIISVFSGMMFYQARRAKTPSVEAALSQDKRPPLLYLRSFDQEANRFVEVSPYDAAKYSEITSYQRNAVIYNLTLEQFLSREIQHTIGPFIALGNPTDYLPPEGASRTYATDGGWQEYFTDLSNRSTAILMQMGNSDNLNWELVSIRDRGMQKRLFIVTPPLSDVGHNSITGFFTRLTDRIKGIQPATWDRFAATLEKAGYKPADDPGDGAVVTFDGNKRAITLVTGAKTPTEYVEAIARQIEDFPEQRAEVERQRIRKEEGYSADAERDRVEKYGVQIVICSSCGTRNSLSFSNCIKCSKDLSREKPISNPYL